METNIKLTNLQQAIDILKLSGVNEAAKISLKLQGRIHNVRIGKKTSFVELRIQHQTVQLVVDSNIVNSLTLESIVKISGKLVKLQPGTIKSCTVSDHEIHVDNMEIVSKNNHELPLQVHNANKIESHICLLY